MLHAKYKVEVNHGLEIITLLVYLGNTGVVLYQATFNSVAFAKTRFLEIQNGQYKI